MPVPAQGYILRRLQSAKYATLLQLLQQLANASCRRIKGYNLLFDINSGGNSCVFFNGMFKQRLAFNH